MFFVCSGGAGLILEVVWTRILTTVFGNTVFAASTVLTAFMLGLAVGSYVLGRVADRVKNPLLLYGGLEIATGLIAFLFPVLTLANNAVYTWFFRAVEPGFGLMSAVRFLLSMAILLPPCFFMGGTLPVLGKYMGHDRAEPGQAVGYLYAANTWGAVMGCFLAGFVLIEALGVRGTLMAAGSTALLIGLLAALLAQLAPDGAAGSKPVSRPGKKKRSKKAKESETPPKQAILSPGLFRLLLVAFAVTGFCSLAYEVLWTRILIFVLTTSVYSFATMLTTFLAGIAAGSFLSARFLVPRIGRPLLWFGIIEILVGVTVLLSVVMLANLEAIDFILLRSLSRYGDRGLILARFADAFLVLFVPTLLMGAAFPVVLKTALTERSRIGARVGQLYAANTIGCVLGAFSGGFVLLPLLAVHRSLLLVVALNFAVGVVFVWMALPANRKAVRYVTAGTAAAVSIAALVFIPSNIFYRTINAHHYPSEIVEMIEHPTGTVTVHRFPTGERLLAVDGVNVAGDNFMLRSTQKLQGYIPLILHPNPQKVVQIGFGSGETARVGLDFGVPDYTVVEICPAVFKADDHFRDINGGSNRDDRIHRVIMDGKNFALLTDEKFDIIMNDSIYPGSGGSSALYTYDHFRHCRERLAEGGLFSCWVPLDLRPREMTMILRSFQDVFPHTSFWVASNCLNKHGLILGTLEPLEIDYRHIEEVMSRPDVADDLRGIAIENPLDFIECFSLSEDAIRRITVDAPLNTDNRPRLEFSCAVPASWEDKLHQVLGILAEQLSPVSIYVVNLPEGGDTRRELARRFRATRHIFRAHVAQLAGVPAVRQRELELALAACPGERDIASCQAELAGEIEDLKRALSQPALADNPTLLWRLGDKLSMAAFEPNGHIDRASLAEAAACFEDLLARPARAAPGLYLRAAEAELHLGRDQHAEQLLAQCLRAWPQSARAHDLMAQLQLRQGRPDMALRYAETALQLSPGDPELQAHLEALRKGQ